MDKLNLFYQDEVTRETVKLWLNQCAEEYALKQLREGKDVSAFKTATDIISDSFIKLDERFGKVKTANKINQAK